MSTYDNLPGSLPDKPKDPGAEVSPTSNDQQDIALADQYSHLIASKEKAYIASFLSNVYNNFWTKKHAQISTLTREELIAYMKLFNEHFPDQDGTTVNKRWNELIDETDSLEDLSLFVERIHAAIVTGYDIKQKQEEEDKAKNAATSAAADPAAASPSSASPVTTPPAAPATETPSVPPIHPPSNLDVKHRRDSQAATSGPATSSPTTDANAGSDISSKAAHATNAYASNGKNAPQQQQQQNQPLHFQPQQSAHPSQPAAPQPMQHQYETRRKESVTRLANMPANNPIVAEGDKGPRTEAQMKVVHAKISRAITDKYSALDVRASYNDVDGSVKVSIPHRRNPQNPQQRDEMERRVENGRPKVRLTNPPDDLSIQILLDQNADIAPLKMSKLCDNRNSLSPTNLDTIVRLMEASAISGKMIEFHDDDMVALDALRNSQDANTQTLLNRFDYLDAIRYEQGPELEAFQKKVSDHEEAGSTWEYGRTAIPDELLRSKPEPQEDEAEPPSPDHP